MPYYINLNGRLTQVSEEEYRLFNVGTSTSPAAGGTETTISTDQQIINPNTTTTQLSLQDQIAAVAAQQPPSATNAATADQVAAIERIQANRATPQPTTTLDAQIAAIRSAQVENGSPDNTATSNDPATQDQTDRIQRLGSQTVENTTPQSLDEQVAAVRAAQEEADAIVAEQNQAVDDQDPFEAARLQAEQDLNNEVPENYGTPEDLGVDPATDEELAVYEAYQADNRAALAKDYNVGAEPSNLQQIVGKNNAQDQKTRQARANKFSQGDWRVRLSLAQNSTYLYNDPDAKNGILAPLAGTNGVIFPYTPSIEMSYQAKYGTTDLTHSNYRGYFYQNSYVDNINIRGVFTAQDSNEARYLLAVIHFFRTVTKMFYGQDQQAGTPPPLVFLSGLGQFQFNNHPCVVSNFQYSLPNDVDYIRADAFNNYGLNLENRKMRSTGPGVGGTLGFLATKLGINGLSPGGLFNTPTQNAVLNSVTNPTNNDSTYVPTKMEIGITLLPMQTRSKISQQFSLKGFANGNLLKGGFW